MDLEVEIEIRSIVNKVPNNLAGNNTYSFSVFVQGVNGNHIEHFVKEIAFYLPPDASNPIEVRNKPPYLISGSTEKSFQLFIDLSLNSSQHVRKLHYSYYVLTSEEKARCVKTLRFLSTPSDFKERLLLGGAEAINHKKRPNTIEVDTRVKSEPVWKIENKDVKIKKEISDELLNTSVQREAAVQSSSMVVERIHDYNELFRENKISKEQNETLRRIFSEQESVIATFNEKFLDVKKRATDAIRELNQLIQKSKANQVEISNLKAAIKFVMSEILQRIDSLNSCSQMRENPEMPFIMSSPITSENCQNDIQALGDDLNLTYITSKNQFRCNLSENEVSSTNGCSLCHITKANEIVLNSLHEKIGTENSLPSSEQNKILSCAHNLNGCKAPFNTLTGVGISENQVCPQNTSSSIANCFAKPYLLTEKKAILKTEETECTVSNIKAEPGTQVRKADQNVLEELALQESPRNNQLTCSLKINKMSEENNLKKLCNSFSGNATQQHMKANFQLNDQRKSKDCNNTSRKKKESVSNLSEKESSRNASKETTENCKTEKSQVIPPNHKNTESAVPSILEIYQFLNDSSLNKKRTKSLSSTVKRKKHCRTEQCLFNSKQTKNCSKPSSISLNISNSLQDPLIAEQVCPPVTSSLNTFTTENKASVPVHIKKIELNCKSALNSVHGIPDLPVKSISSQSISNGKIHKFDYVCRPENAIKNILKDIDDRLLCEAELNYSIHSLTEFFLKPEIFPYNTRNLIYLVIDYCISNRKNYLLAFKENPANCVLLSQSESCIVSSLFQVATKSILCENIIHNVLNTIHQLLVSTKRIFLLGLASLCRIYAEICRKKRDFSKPLALCAALLKVNHNCSPYLIASVVGVWREPFSALPNQSVEAMILLASIALRIKKKERKRLRYCDWKCSVDFIMENFGYQNLPDVNKTIVFLKDEIISSCIQKSFEKARMLASSFVLLSANNNVNWTKKHIINDYIIPNLTRFSSEELNEGAFGFFCILLVDVCYVRDCFGSFCENIFQHVIENSQPRNKENNFVDEWTKVALMKQDILKGRQISYELSKWFEENCKLNVGEFMEMYQQRDMHREKNKNHFTHEDITVT